MWRYGKGAAALCCIGVFVGLMLPETSSAGQSGWIAQRQSRFTDWRQAHPDIESRVEDMKDKTDVLVARFLDEKKLIAENRKASLLKHSRALSSSQKKQVRTLVERAQALSKAKNWPQASILLAEALNIDAADAEANYEMGVCLREQGDLAGAAAYMVRAIMFPDTSRVTGGPYFKAMVALQALPAPPEPDVSDPPAIFRVADAPAEVWDSPEASVMTIVPAGSYTMGSPTTEMNHQPSETPHRVTIVHPFAVGKYDVTRGEFAAFVDATGYDAKGELGCYVYGNAKFTRDPSASWKSPGFEQSDDDPVVCINHDDGVAYAAWLSRKTGHAYRLPSEAEWEYAVRGGTTTAYAWGDDVGIGHANCDGCDNAARAGKPTPGGTYPPNGFGLYDVTGNVWKWLADCWNNTYIGAPTDGSAWLKGTCALRGRRGGSWFNLAEGKPGDFRVPFRLRAAARYGSIPEIRYSSFGLRVVRAL